MRITSLALIALSACTVTVASSTWPSIWWVALSLSTVAWVLMLIDGHRARDLADKYEMEAAHATAIERRARIDAADTRIEAAKAVRATVTLANLSTASATEIAEAWAKTMRPKTAEKRAAQWRQSDSLHAPAVVDVLEARSRA